MQIFPSQTQLSYQLMSNLILFWLSHANLPLPNSARLSTHVQSYFILAITCKYSLPKLDDIEANLRYHIISMLIFSYLCLKDKNALKKNSHNLLFARNINDVLYPIEKIVCTMR